MANQQGQIARTVTIARQSLELAQETFLPAKAPIAKPAQPRSPLSPSVPAITHGAHRWIPTDPRPAAKSTGDHINMSHVMVRVQDALVQLGRMESASLDSRCMNLLSCQGPLDQLLILSSLCFQLRPKRNASAALTAACKMHTAQRDAHSPSWLIDSRKQRKGLPWFMGKHARSLLATAEQRCPVITADSCSTIESAVSVLPPPLHLVALCFAIAVHTEHPNHQERALEKLQLVVAQMQKLLQQQQQQQQPSKPQQSQQEQPQQNNQQQQQGNQQQTKQEARRQLPLAGQKGKADKFPKSKRFAKRSRVHQTSTGSLQQSAGSSAASEHHCAVCDLPQVAASSKS